MINDDTLQVRDKRANNRYFVDNALLRGGWGNKLGPHAIAVYNAIALHADNDTQTAYPSHQKIADLTGMSSRQVSRELEKLATYKIIHIESRANQRKSSLITLLDVNEWIPTHQTEGHMPESHMSPSQPTTDSQSDEHMTGSHTNKTHENNTQGTKPMRGAAEKTPPAPSLRDQAQKGQMTTETEIALLCGFGRQGQAGIADPSHDQAQWFKYREKALSIFIENGGDLGKQSSVIEGRKNAILGFVSQQEEFDMERWANSVNTAVIIGGVNGDNLGCFFDTYRDGGNYQAMCEKRNGGKNAKNRRNTSGAGISGNRRQPEYKVADPSKFEDT